jgi:CRP-like cAMP-binding protein
LLNKIKRYLEYNQEMKSDLKIEEQEVMDLLNDDLRSTLTLYANGRILQTVPILGIFPLEFLSRLTFVLIKRSYALDEYLFREGDTSRDLYFIVNGRISLIHRASYTFLADLHKEASFGEISFFSDTAKRQCTAKAADYSETLHIRLSDFLESASQEAIEMYHRVKNGVDEWKREF